MKITKLSKILLKWFYDLERQGDFNITSERVISTHKISESDFKMAIKYLKEKGWVDFVWMLGTNPQPIMYKGITPSGI